MPQIYKNFKSLSAILATIVVVIGLIVIGGWHTHNVHLTQIMPNWAPMQYNTALCFVLSALGILTQLFFQKKTLSTILCGLALIICGVTTFEYLSSYNLGIDQLFFQTDILTKTSHAGRMSPLTTLCFLLLNSGLLVWRRWQIATYAVALVVFILASLSLVSYFFVFESIYGMGTLQRMALHTAFCFIISGISIIMALSINKRKNVIAGLSIFTFILLFSFISLISQGLDEVITQSNNQYIKDLFKENQSIIQERFNAYEKTLLGAVGYISMSDQVTQDEWQSYTDFLNIRSGLYGVNSMGYISYNPKGTAEDGQDHMIVTHIAPESNLKELGKDYSLDPIFSHYALLSADHEHAALTSAMEFEIEGAYQKNCFIMLYPVYQKSYEASLDTDTMNNLRGWVFIPFIADQFVEGLYDPQSTQVEFIIYEQTGDTKNTIYKTPGFDEIVEKGHTVYDSHVTMSNQHNTWYIQWGVSKNFAPISSSFIVLITFIFGTILSLSISIVTYFMALFYSTATKREQKHQKKLAFAIESGNVGFWEYDTILKKLIYANSSLLQLGWTQEELEKKEFLWTDFIHKDDIKNTYKALEDYQTGKSDVYQSEYRIEDKEGNWRWILSRGKFMESTTNDTESSPLIIGTHTDITQLKIMQDELIDAKTEAEKADKTKTKFLANMSHEIRTPMNGIIGMVDLLLDTTVDDRQKEYLQVIQQSALNLLNIINEILDFSKIEAGKFEIHKREMNVQATITSQVKIIEPLILQKNLEFEIIYDDDVPMTTMSDPLRFQQIILNLCSNALKFTNSGKISIHVSFEQGNNRIHIDVTDTGIGIPKDKQQAVFESFTQHYDEKHVSGNGTGLGLAICKKLVEMMGGEISIKSQPGEGSTFSFYIPHEEPVSDHDDDADDVAFLMVPEIDESKQKEKESPKIEPEKPSKDTSDYSSIRILVAEDIATNQFVISEFLKKIGCAYKIVNNGQEAVDIMATEPFDLILMDCEMPVMNGYDATKTLRAQGHTLPIIALTANVVEGNQDKCIESGMNDFLSKPIKQQEVIQKLSDYIKPSDNNQKNNEDTHG